MRDVAVKPKVVEVDGRHEVHWPAFGFGRGEVTTYLTAEDAQAAIDGRIESGGCGVTLAGRPSTSYGYARANNGWPKEAR